MKKKSAIAKKNTNESSLVNGAKYFLNEVGGISVFTGKVIKESVRRPREFNQFLKQCYMIGYKSLPLVTITAFIMGLVLTIQSRPVMEDFGAESWLPGMVAVSIVREIGPVITALICAGKAGSGIGAELGSMRVTEQIDAMDVSGHNAFKYLVVTRVMAAMVMIPVLVIISDAVALYGSYVGVNIEDDVSLRYFFSSVFQSLYFEDVIPAVIKTFFFGFAIGLMGCYKGYNATKGTEGVGRAANAAVVYASLMVFVLDMIAVQLTSIFT